MQIHLNFQVLTSQTEENKHTNEVIEVSVKKSNIPWIKNKCS